MAQAVQLLQCSVDEDDESHFRFLCDKKHIKYVTIAAGLFTADDMCFAPALIPLLPSFPPGDWNCGYVEQDLEHHKPHFARVVKEVLPAIKNAWHSTHLDYLSLTYGKKLRSNVYEATSPTFDTTVVAKFARFDWEIEQLDRECETYQWIDGQHIGPEFLGHIVEEGRVIGFVMEHILNAQHASPNDLEACQEKLSSLHRLGILHGDANRFNFLVKDGHVTLLDFDCAKKCDDPAEFERELQHLVGQLSDTSGRGGMVRVAE